MKELLTKVLTDKEVRKSTAMATIVLSTVVASPWYS